MFTCQKAGRGLEFRASLQPTAQHVLLVIPRQLQLKSRGRIHRLLFFLVLRRGFLRPTRGEAATRAGGRWRVGPRSSAGIRCVYDARRAGGGPVGDYTPDLCSCAAPGRRPLRLGAIEDSTESCPPRTRLVAGDLARPAILRIGKWRGSLHLCSMPKGLLPLAPNPPGEAVLEAQRPPGDETPCDWGLCGAGQPLSCRIQ